MYRLFFKPLFFLLSPETAHKVASKLLLVASQIPGLSFLLKKSFCFSHPNLKREVFGLRFPNPVGLAAGYDKDAELIDAMANLGFGFVEIGTITPRPQSGNPKPRLFRLSNDLALINRMGFNNKGLEAAIEKLKDKKHNIIVGGNIGKNKDTPNENAVEDYEICFLGLYPYVDYFVVNVSSPNTPGLRDLQEKEPLKKLLNHLLNLREDQEVKKPVLLKIAPDLNTSQLDDILEIVELTQIDGLIATNTTIDRNNLRVPKEKTNAIGAGGLSGFPLKDKSTEIIQYLTKNARRQVPVIGVGGIGNGADALEKLKAGASLVQVYTGLIYNGPGMVNEINRHLAKYL
ncbi:MAG: quinone-dependent dihydroorotate dehydrogenase [Cyclobacteriaceae bacterium]|nr:quinone-dependent dihydroorotate dehydrogenase [Cyclobacteriaceae bacterium]